MEYEPVGLVFDTKVFRPLKNKDSEPVEILHECDWDCLLPKMLTGETICF